MTPNEFLENANKGITFEATAIETNKTEKEQDLEALLSSPRSEEKKEIDDTKSKILDMFDTENK
eukprot:gene1510-12636_t